MSHQPTYLFIFLIALSACDKGKQPAQQQNVPSKPAPPPQRKEDAAAEERAANHLKNISDEVLNGLVKRGATEKEIIAIYGPPYLSQNASADYIQSRVLGFNFAAPFPALRKKGGRVGFTATLNEGKITSWREIYKEPTN
jgi:hypothetical protein